MKRCLLLVMSNLVGLPTATLAQQPVPLTRPGVYLGLQASYGRYPSLTAGFSNENAALEAIYPAAITIGYLLNSVYAVELGFTGHFPATQRTSNATYAYEYANYAYAFSLLARRTIFQPARAKGWRASLVGGLVVVKAKERVSSYYLAGPLYPASSVETAVNDGQLALGIGTCYGFNQHWQLTGDVQGQLSLSNSLLSSVVSTSHFKPLGAGAAIGIRYSL